MTHPLFSDTVTVYRKNGEQYDRHVLEGVQWQQKTERMNDGGKLALAAMTSVTIPESAGMAVKPGDVLVLGTGPEITGEYTIARLRAEDETYCTVRTVADNTLRPRLKHWKVMAV